MNFFKAFFGKNWKNRIFFFLVIYFFLMFWPIFIFWEKISFKPATFTQRWIESLCSVSIIFLILEYQKFLFDVNRKKISLVYAINKDLIGPLSQLLKKTPESKDYDLLILKNDWNRIYPKIKSLDLNAFNINLKNEKLNDVKTGYQLEQLDKDIARINLIGDNSFFDIAVFERNINDVIRDSLEEINQLK